jgi:hypothetical protein
MGISVLEWVEQAAVARCVTTAFIPTTITSSCNAADLIECISATIRNKRGFISVANVAQKAGFPAILGKDFLIRHRVVKTRHRADIQSRALCRLAGPNDKSLPAATTNRPPMFRVIFIPRCRQSL